MVKSLYIFLLFVTAAALSGCVKQKTHIATSYKNSLWNYRMEAKQILDTYQECERQNQLIWSWKYPPKPYPEFQAFKKRLEDLTPDDFADKRRISSKLEANALIELVKGVNSCAEALLQAEADVTNGIVSNTAKPVAAMLAPYNLVVSEYLNGSITRGEGWKKYANLVRSFRGDTVGMQKYLQTEMKEMRIGRAKKRERNQNKLKAKKVERQRWLNVIQAVGLWSQQQHQNYIARHNAMVRSNNSDDPPFCMKGNAVKRADVVGNFGWQCE